MPHPSPWRAASGVTGLFGALGAAFGVLVWVQDGTLVAIPLLGGMLFALGGIAEGQAALRLNWTLREFAGQIPGEPDATVSRLGDQSLRWPALDLAIEGATHRFRVRGPTVTVDGAERSVPSTRPREAAREVLDQLDREPAFEHRTDRLPSIYPRLSGLRVGIPLGAGALVVVALAGSRLATIAPPLLWLGGALGFGIVAGAIRWAGLARVRAGLLAFADGLADGGVTLERIDRREGGYRQQFAVRTPDGTVTLRCGTLPGGRLHARHVDRELERSLSEARDAGRAVASWLTVSPVDTGTGPLRAPSA